MVWGIVSTLLNRTKGLPETARAIRHEERILANFSVELTWFSAEGKMFTEQTRIEDVTSVGCRFSAAVEFHRGDVISIKPLTVGQRSLAGVRAQLFEVMWAASLGGRWTTGARKLEGEKLANVKFPPASYSPDTCR
jgi:hypothetical protein